MKRWPVDEVAIARARRRLDSIIAENPEVASAEAATEDDVTDWIATLLQEEGTEDMAKEPTTQVAFRLPDSLIGRLDRHVERMNGANPGLEFTRTEAVRSLLTRALDEIEGAKRGRKGKP